MTNPNTIEIHGEKTIVKLCKFGADQNMEGCSFTEIVDRMFDWMEDVKAQLDTEKSLRSMSEHLNNTKQDEINELKARAVPNGALDFMKKFIDGHRIVSSGDLTDFQISNAQVEDRMYVEPNGGLGWVALPWDLTTTKDKQREVMLTNRV